MSIDRKAVYAKCNGHCAYCGKEISIKEMQVDHQIPKSTRFPVFNMQDVIKYSEEIERLRNHINSFDNMYPACRKCNFYKSSMPLEEFRKELKSLIERCKKPFIVRLAIDYGILSENEWDGEFYFEKIERLKEYFNQLATFSDSTYKPCDEQKFKELDECKTLEDIAKFMKDEFDVEYHSEYGNPGRQGYISRIVNKYYEIIGDDNATK